MSVIPFPVRASTLERFGQCRRDMLRAFAGLVECGEYTPEQFRDEIDGTTGAMTAILELMEIERG